MQQSHFDLEVYARTYQDDALRRARQVRLLDEAESRGQVSRPGLRDTISALLADFRARFSPAPAPSAAPALIDEAAVPDFSRIVVEEPPARAQAPRAANPYAAMMVIARASNVPVAGQPVEVKDC